MMANLFSSFDPCLSIYSLNWSSTLIVLMLMPMMFWLSPSRWSMMWSKLTMFIHNEMKIINNHMKGVSLILISLFIVIMINNMMGLLPYIFTSTSHMVMTLSLALPMWLSLMIYGWLNNTRHMLAHLVPMGTPTALMSFMVLIESISNLIRPGTLAVRLMANMVAGHLIMTLISSSPSSYITIMVVVMSQLILIMLEFAVAIIQSYVFTVLSALYSSEV